MIPKNSANRPLCSLDTAVQQTNDDSAVSKRSAVRCGYFEDSYLRHFITKVSRRTPLINRGYFLRMKVMTSLVEDTIRHFPPNSPVQVISLGCGFDTLAFRLHGQPTFEHARFFEIDFPAVVERKIDFMRKASLDTFSLFPSARSVLSSTHEIHTDWYHLIGIDLRNEFSTLLNRLSDLDSQFSVDFPTICYAECVTQYLPPDSSDAMLTLLIKTFPMLVFISYDQIQPHDSFGKMMQSALVKKNSPLLGIGTFSSPTDFIQRAKNLGALQSEFLTCYDFSHFCIQPLVCPIAHSLEEFDEFEDWAEMCEHYGIFLLSTIPFSKFSLSMLPIVQHKRSGKRYSLAMEMDPDKMTYRNDEAFSSKIEKLTVPIEPFFSNARASLEGWGFGQVFLDPLSSSSSRYCQISDDNLPSSSASSLFFVAFHGFRKTQKHQRVSDIWIMPFHADSLPLGAIYEDDFVPPPLVFHSITQMSNGLYLMHGGRTSPQDVSSVTYCAQLTLEGAASEIVRVSWTSLRSCFPEGLEMIPRFRHMAIRIDAVRLLIFGGLTKASREMKYSTVLGDLWLGTFSLEEKKISWMPISWPSHAIPSPRHSGVMMRLNISPSSPPAWMKVFSPIEPQIESESSVSPTECYVLLSGGMTDTFDSCLGDFWILKLSLRLSDTAFKKEWSAGIVETHLLPLSISPRFSHQMTTVRLDDNSEHVFLLGGSTFIGPKDDYLIDSAILIDIDTLTRKKFIEWKSSLPIETFTRHQLVPFNDGREVAIIGGGFICFSFGTYLTKAMRVIFSSSTDFSSSPHSTFHKVETKKVDSHLLPSVSATGAKSSLSSISGHQCHSNEAAVGFPSGIWTSPYTVMEFPYSEEKITSAFQHINTPFCMRGVELGSCLVDWQNPEYLNSKQGDMTVSIHESSSSLLNFTIKNFRHTHVRFSELIAHCWGKGREMEESPNTCLKWYFRSVSRKMKTTRANFWNDFTHIADDFTLPKLLESIVMPFQHQSCLRINGPGLTLWCHYDTMDNILCQIVGTKRVRLFPPHQYNNLYLKGSSSKIVDMDSPDFDRFPRFREAIRYCHEIILKPGDVLYIPNFWFHELRTTDESPSISLNLFYKRLPSDKYDPKDLYGNKDPPCVTELRDHLLSVVKMEIDQFVKAKDVPKECATFSLHQFVEQIENHILQMEASH